MPNAPAFREALEATINGYRASATFQRLGNQILERLEVAFDPLLETERLALAYLLVEVLTDALALSEGTKT